MARAAVQRLIAVRLVYCSAFGPALAGLRVDESNRCRTWPRPERGSGGNTGRESFWLYRIAFSGCCWWLVGLLIRSFLIAST